MSRHPALSGLKLVLGGNVFGWTADQDTSFEILDAFYEAGGRMVDTAEVYSAWVPGHKGGESETVIGAWMKDRGVRKDMRIATKTGWGMEHGDLNPATLEARLQGSLERLQTDYVDLYYAHRDDPTTPQDEMAQGFAALVSAGKVRELGASNFTEDRLRSAIAAAKAQGVPGFSVLQNQYNLLERGDFDADYQNFCVANDVAMLPYFGLASGYLTGKYRKDADLKRFVRGDRVKQYHEGQGPALLTMMDQIAKDCEATVAQVALAWLLDQPGIAAPIASATTADQLDELIEAIDIELMPDQNTLLTKAISAA
ncbi:aldo/keto reductase [Novosphingobium sp.]|uniref:aldo/keto reductase n=1 Tax=Novosphingobium sp. TaxID=1874826 RepID=UPI0025F5297A|nr:aldo/keto reductase [Novosphingobium sp.]MCC6925896.1 aldo/keto reductase [Novosphingobium sp.]